MKSCLILFVSFCLLLEVEAQPKLGLEVGINLISHGAIPCPGGHCWDGPDFFVLNHPYVLYHIKENHAIAFAMTEGERRVRVDEPYRIYENDLHFLSFAIDYRYIWNFTESLKGYIGLGVYHAEMIMDGFGEWYDDVRGYIHQEFRLVWKRDGFYPLTGVKYSPLDWMTVGLEWNLPSMTLGFESDEIGPDAIHVLLGVNL